MERELRLTFTTNGGFRPLRVAGLAAAAAQLYVSVAWGPYLALLVVGLLTPVADRLFKPKPFA